jgi:hypothetical protein
LLRYIRAQQTAAAAIAVVCPKTISHAEAVRLGEIAGQSVVTLRCRASLRSEAWNTGYSSLRERVGSGFFLFLDGDDLLQPDCLALMKQTFAHRPEAGLVAGWTGREDSFPMDVPLCPELSHQLMRTELGSACAFRAEAIGNAVPFRALPKHYDLWQLSVAVLANGWIGVTVAAMLAERRGQQDKLPWPETTALRAIRAEILQTAAGRISPIALDLLNDYAPLSSPADAGAKSGVAQIMKLLKAGARRKISNVRTRLLPSRRPKEPA